MRDVAKGMVNKEVSWRPNEDFHGEPNHIAIFLLANHQMLAVVAISTSEKPRLQRKITFSTSNPLQIRW
jgi:hypothetical protein